VQTALWVFAAALGAAALALGLAQLIHLVVIRLARRSIVLAELARHAHRPFQVAATALAVQIAARVTTHQYAGQGWRRLLLHTLVIAVIAASAWLVAALLLVSEDAALARYRTDVPDNRTARRVHTQVRIMRRVTVALILLVAAGIELMTFPQVRTVGASLLASAGLIGVVGALAAQSVLSNVFAGIQLAFSGAVRLDDVVVVEGEWGRIEELTLTYVVLHVWDDRRLIMPTSYYTSKPFQNWTRSQAAVLGTVEVDADWSLPVPDMRDELRRFVEESTLWDGRVCVLQVTESVGGMVRVRALVSAQDAPTLWDLRCLVREHLVAWMRDCKPTSVPRYRAELADASARHAWQWVDRRRRAPLAEPAEPSEGVDGARVFGGSSDGQARNEAFGGPAEEKERTENADPAAEAAAEVRAEDDDDRDEDRDHDRERDREDATVQR
jgi:small-conductance mechanosensitive channel